MEKDVQFEVSLFCDYSDEAKNVVDSQFVCISRNSMGYWLKKKQTEWGLKSYRFQFKFI